MKYSWWFGGVKLFHSESGNPNAFSSRAYLSGSCQPVFRSRKEAEDALIAFVRERLGSDWKDLASDEIVFSYLVKSDDVEGETYQFHSSAPASDFEEAVQEVRSKGTLESFALFGENYNLEFGFEKWKDSAAVHGC